MAAKQPHYSPKKIAIALQTSESTVKRWCDQERIATIRTSGGHRRISLDALQNFLRETGRTIDDPEALGLPPLRSIRMMDIPGSDQLEKSEFRQAICAGDEGACRRILRSALQDGRTCSEVAEEFVSDAMQGIGNAWACRELDPYQERRGCEICMRLLRELLLSLPPLPADAPQAIGGSASGDLYQLPSALVELTLREGGWDAANLGSNLPIDSFIQAAFDCRPDLVWISTSHVNDPDTYVAENNRLAASLPDDVALLVGGRALTDQLRPRLRYTAYCDSLRNLADLAGVIRAGVSGKGARSGMSVRRSMS